MSATPIVDSPAGVEDFFAGVRFLIGVGGMSSVVSSKLFSSSLSSCSASSSSPDDSSSSLLDRSIST